MPEFAGAALTGEHAASHLREALLRLPEQQRTVLALVYFEGLTLPEIATVLGYAESRVTRLRTKALAALRDSLRPPTLRAA